MGFLLGSINQTTRQISSSGLVRFIMQGIEADPPSNTSTSFNSTAIENTNQNQESNIKLCHSVITIFYGRPSGGIRKCAHCVKSKKSKPQSNEICCEYYWHASREKEPDNRVYPTLPIEQNRIEQNGRQQAASSKQQAAGPYFTLSLFLILYRCVYMELVRKQGSKEAIEEREAMEPRKQWK